MADTTPYGFPDADEASQDRYLEQQIAQAASARSVTNGETTVVYQDPLTLQKLQDHRESRRRRPSRMHTVYVSHARRT